MTPTSYERAVEIVKAIEAVQGPLPPLGPYEHIRRPGLHTIEIETATRLGKVHSVLRRAWQQVRAGQAFPRLQGHDVTQQMALRIILLIRPLPASERDAEIERLVKLSLTELKRLRPLQPGKKGQTPAPRASKSKPIGQRWHDQLVEIRQHLMALQRAGLLEHMVRGWSPDVRHGYLQEVRQIIAQLQSIAERIDAGMSTDVPMAPLLTMPSSRARR